MKFSVFFIITILTSSAFANGEVELARARYNFIKMREVSTVVNAANGLYDGLGVAAELVETYGGSANNCRRGVGQEAGQALTDAKKQALSKCTAMSENPSQCMNLNLQAAVYNFDMIIDGMNTDIGLCTVEATFAK